MSEKCVIGIESTRPASLDREPRLYAVDVVQSAVVRVRVERGRGGVPRVAVQLSMKVKVASALSLHVVPDALAPSSGILARPTHAHMVVHVLGGRVPI